MNEHVDITLVDFKKKEMSALLDEAALPTMLGDAACLVLGAFVLLRLSMVANRIFLHQGRL